MAYVPAALQGALRGLPAEGVGETLARSQGKAFPSSDYSLERLPNLLSRMENGTASRYDVVLAKTFAVCSSN